MNEQLLKIEKILLESSASHVLLAGVIMIILGAFLWLGGLKYLKVVSGMLGGATGAMLGSIIAASFSLHLMGTIAITAAVFAIGAILLQQLIILLIATVIFGMIFGGGYMEYAIGKVTPQDDNNTKVSSQYDNSNDQQTSDNAFHADNPFGNMKNFGVNPETVSKTSNAVVKTGEYVGTFYEKIKAVLSELTPTMSNNAGYLIMWCVLGAIVGLVLAKLLKTLVMALCCSIVGSTSVVAGLIIAIISKGNQLWTNLQGHSRVLTMVFISMVLFGWLFQILTSRKSNNTLSSDKSDKE